MANHPKLITIPGTFLDTVEKLLHTPPPPKTAKDGTRKKKGTRKKGRG
jgi:hypothetical protein